MQSLKSKAASAAEMLKNCVICPRKCGVNRLKGELGFCKTGINARVCSFMPHHGEEPPVSGTRGSGTIFFSNCNLRCNYCQNYSFSQEGEGREVDTGTLASFMLELQKEGCHNINLVTPTHVMPQILQALDLAKSKGLDLPVVYNTSGYELSETIKFLDGVIDIYLADMRYGESSAAEKYSSALDYPYYNMSAIKEMHRQIGIPEFDKEGIIKKGLIIRHLVLPNRLSGTEQIMKFLHDEVSIDTYISLMSQYGPYYKALKLPEINRKITVEEYSEAKGIMDKYSLTNGWIQDSFGLERFAGVHIKSNILKGEN